MFSQPACGPRSICYPFYPLLDRFRDGQRIATSASGETEVATTVGGDAIESRLTIRRAATAAHSGTYECSPDNIKPAKIYLHVVEGWLGELQCIVQGLVNNKLVNLVPAVA